MTEQMSPAPAETSEASAQTEAAPIDVAGTSNALPPVYSVPPRPRGIPLSVMLISQAAWTKVVTQLATLTAKVGNMKGRV